VGRAGGSSGTLKSWATDRTEAGTCREIGASNNPFGMTGTKTQAYEDSGILQAPSCTACNPTKTAVQRVARGLRIPGRGARLRALAAAAGGGAPVTQNPRSAPGPAIGRRGCR
jgi:hypothetical protein